MFCSTKMVSLGFLVKIVAKFCCRYIEDSLQRNSWYHLLVSYFPVDVIKRHDQTQLIEAKVCLGLWFQRLSVHHGVEAWFQAACMTVGMILGAESWETTSFTTNTKQRKQRSVSRLYTALSDIIPPARTDILNLSNNTSIWGPPIQMSEHMRDISSINHHTMQQISITFYGLSIMCLYNYLQTKISIGYLIFSFWSWWFYANACRRIL